MSLGRLEANGLVSLGRGRVISKHDLVATPGKYPVYSSAKENDGKFGEYGLFMFDEELITWSVDGGGRLFHRPKHRFSVTNVGGTLRVNDCGKLDCRFLFFMLTYLHSIVTFDWVQKAHPSIIRKVYDTVPLPPVEEQRRIVVVLDEAFAAIATATANVERNLANARAVRALLHRRAFAEIGERWLLGELAVFRNGVNFTATSRGEEVRIVGVKDFQDNVFVPDDNLATTRVDGTLPDDDLLTAGDILAVRSNGNKALIGRCMIATKVEERTTHSGFTIRIRADGGRINPQYLCRYLKSPEARERLVAGGSGANISSLNQKVLASLPVPVPSVMDQRRIVETLSEIDHLSESLEAVSRTKLVELAALKQSFLHRAFSGELTQRERLAA